MIVAHEHGAFRLWPWLTMNKDATLDAIVALAHTMQREALLQYTYREVKL